MPVLFWICFLAVVYAYAGYAVLLAVLVRLRPRPTIKRPILPRVSIIMAARNEEARLGAKLENLQLQDYPEQLVEIVVASDGSTDGTNEILQGLAAKIQPVLLPESRGKALALNAAVRNATGEILVFLDARQSVDHSAISELVANFADPAVGAVSGELLLQSADGGSPNALGIYWKIEKTVRKLESASGSVVGVTGAIYAMRRELYVDIPEGTILDDVFVPMQVVRSGRRVIFEPLAIARDIIFEKKGKEFSRKVRTLSGNYQLVRVAPWLLSPRNPVLFRFVSHKLMRLLVPLFLAAMLVTSAAIAEPFYRVVFGLQVIFYGLAGLGSLSPHTRRFKAVSIANTFVMLNAAAAMAFYNFVRRRDGLWVS